MPDPQALALVHAQAFDHAWSAGEIADLLETPGSFLVAETNGFILARVLADEAEIITLAVVPSARRQGLARRLVEAAAVQALALGARALFLEVADNNLAALGLYRGLGFETVGRRRGYYAARGGEPAIDALVMRLSLNS
ncbi:MAG: GNAT family N-acetyltransferase [Caulobacteraceae bacterium]|nr:GNAT family N-acetyltransferase [Caulobacter sp.]RYF95487.1 MAG: GNAT family N-acetyltransferase [Caulobacteraceae bacterium]